MNKCNCYNVGVKSEPRYNQYTGHYAGSVNVKYEYCSGTKEQDECSCGGDCAKCDFYPEVREKADKEEKTVIDSCKDNGYVLSYLDCGNMGIGKIECNPYKNLIIDAETIKLRQKDLGITINISNDILDKIENIEINGYKFTSDRE